MGYLTTITIHNDALHAFREDPEKFGKAILAGIEKANKDHKCVSVSFNNYCNYIHVQSSRHADDETLYLHSGNTVFNLCPHGKDFEDLKKHSSEVLEKFIKRAAYTLKTAKKKLKS